MFFFPPGENPTCHVRAFIGIGFKGLWPYDYGYACDEYTPPRVLGK